MALHILTVDEITFKTHLEYMFIGTGKNGVSHQTGALADILSIRDNDEIIFYVMKKGFFGIFKAIGNVFYDYNSYSNHSPQYLNTHLGGKTLTYRMCIEGFQVYQNCISEWDMMENPDNIQNQSIFNMQWSWIFKKLSGNRGCLSIDNNEADLLKTILCQNNTLLGNVNNYLYDNGQIQILNNNSQYDPSCKNILPRTNTRLNKIYREEDLRILFTAKANNHNILDQVLKPQINGDITLISNEISCSFSERRMDLLFATTQAKCLLIELKNEFIFNDSIYNQIKEYARWISAYKPQYEHIKPILVIKEATILPQTVRRNNRKFKYLTPQDQINNHFSPWYQEILDDINNASIALTNENIPNLEALEVYTFELDQNTRLQHFNQIV